MTKGVKRNYESLPVSEDDAAFVRGFVIHEDSGIIAFNKPSGLPVQTRNVEDRTLDRLMAAFARSNGKRPRLVHRLDAPTSGVIVAAKTQPAAAALSQSFADRLVDKTYLAVVTGSPLPEGVTEFSMPLTRAASQRSRAGGCWPAMGRRTCSLWSPRRGGCTRSVSTCRSREGLSSATPITVARPR